MINRMPLFKFIKRPFKLLKSISVHVIGTITHVSTSDAVLALTFDDGPDPVFTPQLLESLQKYNARATFFMIGKKAAQYPDLVQRVSQEGHAIGNHSWDHPSFPLIQGAERRRQIRACQKALAPFGQRFFRPPYGNQSIMSRLDALLLGYKVITWNLCAVDWLNQNGFVIANRLMEEVQNGSIILFHDSLYDVIEEQYADRSQTLTAVELLLKKLSNKFRFVTIPELLRCGHVQKTHWVMKPDVNFLNNLKSQYENTRRYSINQYR